MGIRRETVRDVSQWLLAHLGGLRGLFRLDVWRSWLIRTPSLVSGQCDEVPVRPPKPDDRAVLVVKSSQ
jgi:hypothetical protein